MKKFRKCVEPNLASSHFWEEVGGGGGVQRSKLLRMALKYILVLEFLKSEKFCKWRGRGSRDRVLVPLLAKSPSPPPKTLNPFDTKRYAQNEGFYVLTGWACHESYCHSFRFGS